MRSRSSRYQAYKETLVLRGLTGLDDVEVLALLAMYDHAISNDSTLKQGTSIRPIKSRIDWYIDNDNYETFKDKLPSSVQTFDDLIIIFDELKRRKLVEHDQMHLGSGISSKISETTLLVIEDLKWAKRHCKY